MLYSIVIFLVKLYCNIIFKLKINGVQNLPKEKGFIIAPNHKNFYDVVFAAIASKRHLNFMAKKELLEIPIIGWFLKQLNVFPVKRGGSDIGAIKTAINILKNDKVLLIFPEGTRSKDGNIGAGKSGVSFIARKAGAIIVPCGISGKIKIGAQITVNIGQPVYADDFTNDDELVSRVMTDIKNLVEVR